MPFKRIGTEAHERDPVVPMADFAPVSCNMDALKTLISSNGKTVMLAVTPTCPYGKEMRELLHENIQKFKEKGITVELLDIDTHRCSKFADNLEIKSCPTVILYEGKTEIRRIVPEGESREELLHEMLQFKMKKLKKVGGGVSTLS